MFWNLMFLASNLDDVDVTIIFWCVIMGIVYIGGLVIAIIHFHRNPLSKEEKKRNEELAEFIMFVEDANKY
jgi:hypothetical protein